MVQHNNKMRTRDRRVPGSRRSSSRTFSRSRNFNQHSIGPANLAGGSRQNNRSSGTGISAGSLVSPDALITRRRLLFGAVGVGVAAAAGIGIAAYNASVGANDQITYLDVPKSSLTTHNDFEALESYEEEVKTVKTFDLPYGSLVWVNDDKVAACLLPTNQGSPLAQVGVLNLESGTLTTVLQRAMGSEEAYEIYDARATSDGVIWTEANILDGTWRVYASSLKDGDLVDPYVLEEGANTLEAPTLAAVGKRAFWQVQPNASAEPGTTSRLMGATFNRDDGAVVFESNRRMATPPYAANDTVTISPRVDSSSVYHQLTNIDAETGKVLDTLTLPHSVIPFEAGYGDTGFMFSFPDIYQFSGAISNLGTYVPFSMPSNSDYSAVNWFSFARTPTAAPAWCNDLLIVKSTYSVCGVDLKSKTYFAIDVENGADSYGEYLASSGSRNKFVTYTNINHKPIDEKLIHACRVKVWTTA